MQHKLQDNSKEFSALIEHRFKIVDDELKRNGLDYIKRANQLRDQVGTF